MDNYRDILNSYLLELKDCKERMEEDLNDCREKLQGNNNLDKYIKKLTEILIDMTKEVSNFYKQDADKLEESLNESGDTEKN